MQMMMGKLTTASGCFPFQGTRKALFSFFFSKTTSHATRYRSVVTTTYIASWKFEAGRNVFKSLAPFSLTGAIYYISHSRGNFLGFIRQKRIPHTRRRVERSPTETAPVRCTRSSILGQPRRSHFSKRTAFCQFNGEKGTRRIKALH